MNLSYLLRYRRSRANDTELTTFSGGVESGGQSLVARLRLYWSLMKGLQTGLLLATGLAGYMSARCPVLSWRTLLGLAGTLFLAIGGSTILNMWYDRDIDAKMHRACRRPLPSGRIQPGESFVVGLFLAAAGVVWAFVLDPLFGAVIFVGLFFDVVVYTIWLKRRSAWSIVIGGVAGAMPVLAGRTLGLGAVDWIGLTLALAVLFWIPTHMLTYNMRYYDDYHRAGIPTVAARYGFRTTRRIIALSSVLAALAMALVALGLGMSYGYLGLMVFLASALTVLALGTTMHSSERLNFGLFKYASLYMLSAMLLIILDAV